MSQDTLRADLRSAIADWDPALGSSVADDTPLISSGRLDSFNLLRLLLWLEDELDRPIDATQIDVASEWDTVDRIVTFVEQHRAAPER
jgi:acyl carrier protein